MRCVNVIMVTRDRNLADAVQASAAAMGQDLEVLRDSEVLRQQWSQAAAVLIGADAAESVAALRLPTRTGVHLIGTRLEELASWSSALGAPVIPMPDSAGVLAGVLAVDHAAPAVWVLGAGGGVGASTLAAALALHIGRSRKTALVELAPFGGGIDLLYGAEAEPGWRWADLAGAVGQLGELAGLLPRAHRVDLVSMGRGGMQQPSASARAAVFGSLARSHEFVVVDGGLQRPPISDLRIILVLAADVRSVASARVMAEELGLAEAEIVVRTGVGRSIEPHLVAEALGTPLLATLPTDRRLARLLEAGRPPGSLPGRYARAVRRIAKAVA